MLKINNKSFALERKSASQKISTAEEKELLGKYAAQISSEIKSIIIIPPDYTRKHSGSGRITRELYELLKDDYKIDIMPALGTHKAMTEQEIRDMFGQEIPLENFLVHDFKNDIQTIGEIPENFVEKISEGKLQRSIEVKINKSLINGEYDLVISVGQVLPHGVVGMSNFNKNVFVGCGGAEMINVSHYLGAVYGIERLLGRGETPVRKLYDYAEDHFLKSVDVDYILTVNSTEVNKETGTTDLLGLYLGWDKDIFKWAVKLSQRHNITKVSEPLEKVVVYMDEKEFKSTWLSCKAIYRTRLAIADGGELIVIAPGLKEFGEYEEVDQLIRKYGYRGSEQIRKEVENNADLKNNLSAAAHLIHGSTEGRFEVTFATDKLSREEIEGVNHNYLPLDKALARYPISQFDSGFNTLINAERVYYIDNPTTGLWTSQPL